MTWVSVEDEPKLGKFTSWTSIDIYNLIITTVWTHHDFIPIRRWYVDDPNLAGYERQIRLCSLSTIFNAWSEPDEPDDLITKAPHAKDNDNKIIYTRSKWTMDEVKR